MRTIVNPEQLGPPRGFSHGVITSGGRLLFLAGQDATGPDGEIVGPGDLLAQFEQVLDNLGAVVAAAGGTLQHVVKLNIFVLDRDDYRSALKPIGRIFRQRFGGYYPAIALFEVSGFFQERALVEIEGIAVLDDEL